MLTRCRTWLFHIPMSTFQPTERLSNLIASKYVKDFVFTSTGFSVDGFIQFHSQVSYSTVFQLLPDSTKIKSTIDRDRYTYVFHYTHDDYYNRAYYKYLLYLQNPKNKR